MAAGGSWEVGARRPRWPLLVLVAVAVPALVLLARGGVPDPGAGIPVETAPGEPSPGRAGGATEGGGEPDAAPGRPAPDPSPPVAAGDWEALGEAPVAVPHDHRAVWTGEELVVFGDRDEIAAYHVEDGRWTTLPSPPVRQAATPAPLWTGSSVLVWGAPSSRSPGRLAVAAYDPASGSWREGATSPLPSLEHGVAVWTGRVALVWGALSSGTKVAGAYDPAGETWTRLPQAPVPPAVGAGGLWSGRELVVWGERVGFGGAPFAAAYEPRTQQWRRLPAPPLERPSQAAAAWTGEDLVLWGTPARGGDEPGATPEPAGAALRVDDDAARWRDLWPAPSGSAAGHGQVSATAAWAGDRLALVGTLTGVDGWLLQPSAGTWRVLPRGHGRRLRPAMVWTGHELLVWGGYTTTGPSVELASWRHDAAADPAECDPSRAGGAAGDHGGGPDTGMPAGWTRSPAAPLSRPASRWSGVVAGSELLALPAVGASLRAPLPVAALDLDGGGWRCLPPAPIIGRADPAVAWTGEEVLVWGGHRGLTGSIAEGGRLGDGAAYHPATDSWRRLPPAPTGWGAPRAVAWTGDELVVWGMPAPTRAPSRAAGAAYDPAADTWRRIADLPLALGRSDAVWTGHELVVSGRPPVGDGDRDRLVVAAYEPVRDTWRLLPDPPLSPLAASVGSAGGVLVAWDYLLQAVAYDEAAGAWTALPAPPLAAGECHPETAAAGGPYLLAWYCDQAALLDVRARSWQAVPRPEEVDTPGRASTPVLVPGADALHAITPDGAVLTFRP